MMAGLGCSSSSELQTIQSQLADIQYQVLQLQKETASKEELAELGQAVAEQRQSALEAQADLRTELQAIASLISRLEATMEDTNYRFSQLSQQLAATNQELKAVRSTPGVGPEGFGDTAVSVDSETLYQTAYSDYLRGSYDLAILGFRQYLDGYSDTDLADNAVYWIGESYYRQRRFQDAIREFDAVLDQYGDSDKLASVHLRKGYAYLELGEQDKGVVHLQHVIREYPSTDEANLARQQLKSLGLDPQAPGR